MTSRGNWRRRGAALIGKWRDDTAVVDSGETLARGVIVRNHGGRRSIRWGLKCGDSGRSPERTPCALGWLSWARGKSICVSPGDGEVP